MNPSALWPILDKSRILEHLQMKGQPRLPGLEGLGEITHTLLTIFQALDDLQPRFVRQSMEETHALISLLNGSRHTLTLQQHFLMSQEQLTCFQ
jgi:hypothetical protein